MPVNLCPTCEAPIDPARAPVARVRGTKVVTYCSAACAEKDARPAAAAEGPSPRARPPTKTEGTATTVTAATDEPGPYPRRGRGNSRRRIVALSSTMLVGGMVITAIHAVSPSTPSDVSASSAPQAARQGHLGHLGSTTPATIDPNATLATDRGQKAEGQGSIGDDGPASDEAPALPPTPEALLARAHATLQGLLQSPSERVQRMAALALSRASDPDALALLRDMIADEPSDLARIEIAYALARSGDEDAKQMLRTALRHDRRDIRLDAARALVQLGDDSGIKVLQRMLSKKRHRMGAAALLARMGDEEGLAMLNDELADDDTSSEGRMRALVALGRAGDANVHEELRKILDDGRFQVGAAEALAIMGDQTAIPALMGQLELASLRVRAALGLRRLGHEVDLAPLADALDDTTSGNDAARVGAAEAILILAGAPELAEFE